MPGKIKVKVLAGRNLPVMDRASDTTDAFVEIKFGGVTHKTDVCRKSLNPHWSSTEWYRFEVDESELQDEPLQLRLMDHDTYSANDAIGKVVISLAPLLAREANNAKGTTGPPGGAVLSGWIPVFDTMHGIRGELNVIVKVELFSDFNKYKTSSCGVQFFHCPMIPPGYKATSIHGFVEELVVNDDPEYQWIDKIRTPRASNEARQVAFIKLSNQVQRLVGLKAAELGANAVVGYQQEFDLEGEAGVVARAIGTAVSVTPLPMPSQPVNTISCTQQQLKKCLDILATDDESVTDLSQYYKTHQEELAKMINLLNPKGLLMLDSQENADDDDDKELVRQTSLNSYVGSVSLYQDNYVSRDSLRHLSEDQTDLNKLLNRKDEEDSDSSGPMQKIKKLKTNFFTKRFTKHKGDKKDEKDNVSLKSNSSDTSRISLYDIKNEFKKLKRLKKPKFCKTINKEDEGEGMASILARSVIHARTTLACITETQDSQAENSPSSTLRRVSESDPNIHVDDDKTIKGEHEKSETVPKKVPEIQFSSLKNISSENLLDRERVRKISESCPTSPMSGRTDNLLKLPGNKGYYGSVSSALSGDSSIYTTSEDEDESSDLKTDTDEAPETTSSIVKSVLRYEADPEYVAQMDRKLTVLLNTPPKISESILADFDKRTSLSRSMEEVVDKTIETPKKEINQFECKVEKAEENFKEIEPFAKPSTAVEKCVPKPNTHYIKIHNPFANRKASTSISCPSSPVEKHNFVYRSSKRIKEKLSKISKSNMIKSISHISLFPKKKEAKTLSQPGSNSDVPSCPSKCPSETVLGSHFLSYSDLFGLDKDKVQANKLCKSDEIGRSKFSMYIGSEPVSRCSISGPSHPHSRDEHDLKKEKHSLKSTGLIHTAMETMLIDKVESLLLPTSPTTVNTKFFDDVSEKLEEHKNSGATMRQLQSTTGSTTPRIVAVTPKRLSEDLTSNIDKLVDKNHQEEAKALTHLLLDKAQSGHTDTSDSSYTSESHDFAHEKHKKKDSRGSISTLMDKVHFHPHLPHVFHHHKKDDIKSGGLIQAAMQTMLIDRAQAMIPDTPEPIPVHAEPDFGEIGKHKHHDHEKEHDHKCKESKGLVHSALQTMLIENVQAVLPDSDEPVPIRTEPNFGEEIHENNHKKVKESTGLVHSALQTMLIENVQAVLPDSDEPIPIRTDPEFGEELHEEHNHKKVKESTGLVHSALQTMLIENVQAVLPDSDKPIPIRTDPEFGDGLHEEHNHKKVRESTGLVHTALQTMLIDNVKSVLPDSDEPIPIRTEGFDDAISQESHGSKESTGLVHTALQTMLIDNVKTVLPGSNEPIPIRTEGFDDTSQMSHGEKESTGLVQTALQTMLIDNVKTVLLDSDKPSPINNEDFNNTTSQKRHRAEEPKGLVHSAKDKIISEKAQALIDPKTVNIESTSSKIDDEHDSQKDLSLMKTVMETMLIDRVQTMFPKTEAKDTHVEKIQDSDSELKSTSLVKNAMQTIIDKTPILVTTDTEGFNNIVPNPQESLAVKMDDLKIKSWSEDSKDSTSDSTNLINRQETKQKHKEDNDEVAKEKDQRNNREKQKKEQEDRNKEIKQRKAFDERKKHFTRQDSVHSVTSQMSNEPNTHKVTKASHHPLSALETIQSVECNDSFDTNAGSFDVPSNKLESVDRAGTRVQLDDRGGSLNTSAGNVGSGGGAILRPSMNSNNLDMLEYPFLTMTEYPPGFIVHIGGAVCARSVKLVDGGGESAARAAWWTELRTELRAHARALRCNAVIAYRDSAAICEDVCVLSASGTAVVINLDCDFNADLEAPTTALNGSKAPLEESEESCSIAHVPYSPGAGPYRAELSTCGGCRRARVPAVLLAACAKPNKLSAYPKSVTLTAVAARIRRAPPSAEPGARDISDQLPFLEYELHKLLLAKLRMQGANALFSLQTQIAIGERCVMAIASGTAVKLTALPPPTPPRIKMFQASEKEKDAIEIQKALFDTFTANKAANGYDVASASELATNGVLPEVDREDAPALDLCADKDACVLELDEAEDVETARALSKRRNHMPAFTNSLRPAAGAQPLAFTQVSRARLVLSSGAGAGAAAERQAERALSAAGYKLRRLAPAALQVALQLDLPEDEIQLVVSGTAIPLADPSKPELSENGQSQSSQSQSSQSQADGNDDDIFELDEEQMRPGLTAQEMVEDKSAVNGQVGSAVSLTTLSQVGVGRSTRRLCALRLLFVRETTAVRELGGLSGFLHTFTCEVLAILRAYTAALGGNALTSFYITQLMLQDNAHKNQGQCLLSVGGDVVHVSY